MRAIHKRRHESEVDAGALTDIMFFLLFFFLILSTITNLNVIKLLLPESSKSTEVAKNFTVVSVTADENYLIGQEKTYPAPPDSLGSIIAREVAAKGNDLLVLRINKGVPIEYLVRVLDIGVQQKLKVVLETDVAK